MKYTRMDISKDHKKDEIPWIINYIIILPVVSIIIGGIVAKFLIVPNVKKKAYAENSQNIQSFDTAYMVQVGVYSNKDNSDIIIKSINSLGYKSAAVESEDGYRVIVDITYDLNASKKIQDDIKKHGYDSFINEISIEKKPKISSESKLINTYIDNIIRLMSFQIMIKDNSKSSSDIVNAMDKYNNAITSSYSDIKKNNTKITDEVSKLNNSFNSCKDEFTKNINCNSKDTYNYYIGKEFLIVKKIVDLYTNN